MSINWRDLRPHETRSEYKERIRKTEEDLARLFSHRVAADNEKIKLELIKELIESVTVQADEAEGCRCSHCYYCHGGEYPDKRTVDLSVQLARAVLLLSLLPASAMEGLPYGCGIYTEVRETLTEFLENFDY
jgi:hypothetical protein